MSTIKDRFIRYIKIDTTSDEHSSTVPSTKIQLDLARVLKQELEEMKLEDVELSEYGYVYAKLASNVDYPCKTVGFIAHMDTAPDFNGTNVNPRIVEKWDGLPIALNEHMELSIEKFSGMSAVKGDDLIVTDGTTLLGADDKAGIAIIMDTIAYLVEHPEIKHGDIMVGFTPDEEIGRGADYFDVKGFNAEFAFTLDGGMANGLCYETFNAYKADVKITGESIHPGGAKGKMINAISIGYEFDQLLPKMMRPEYTEGREGFNHLYRIEGNVDTAHLEYIIRNHDKTLLQEQINDFENAKNFINTKYKKELVEVSTVLQYQNMAELLQHEIEILNIAKEAIRKQGLDIEIGTARGGTDGSRLTFMGLPCPNIGTGGMNAHGPYECVSINQMHTVQQIMLNIVDGVKEIKK
ncbi:MAG: peptidase T [Erysipelotrichaceae bacterium]